MDKVAGSAAFGLKRKKNKEILKLAQPSLEKQTLTLEAASQEMEDMKLVNLLEIFLGLVPVHCRGRPRLAPGPRS